jgi:hypothetical protein
LQILAERSTFTVDRRDLAELGIPAERSTFTVDRRDLSIGEILPVERKDATRRDTVATLRTLRYSVMLVSHRAKKHL